MAFFAITVEKIGRIWAHPKADKMELASCEGLSFQFCVGKNQFQVNDEVLYFPVDTIIPDEVKEKINFRAPGRIKTIQLRGEYSQGFVFSLLKANEIFGVDFKQMSPEEITLFFRATKYEPPQKFVTAGELVDLPVGQGVYDIENTDRYPDVFQRLLDQECYIVEKIEGTNISVSRQTGNLYVCQRANAIIENPDQPNAYWESARESGLIEKLPEIAKYLGDANEDVILMGELIGPSIQSNIYKISHRKVMLFDIRLGKRWISVKDFYEVCKKFEIESAPILAQGNLKEILGGKTMGEYADGFSTLFNTLREGIVLRPVLEQFDQKLGRVILKQHSLRYLAQE
jgi:RNA ligase (TIGR02306 family)